MCHEKNADTNIFSDEVIPNGSNTAITLVSFRLKLAGPTPL
jgi:hypothetical protein